MSRLYVEAAKWYKACELINVLTVVFYKIAFQMRAYVAQGISVTQTIFSPTLSQETRRMHGGLWMCSSDPTEINFQIW